MGGGKKATTRSGNRKKAATAATTTAASSATNAADDPLLLAQQLVEEDEKLLTDALPLSLSMAIRNHDLTALAQALQHHLPRSIQSISNLTLEQTVGEAFTGGRSTPVYAVQCTVHRNNNNNRGNITTKQRHFVVKLVWMIDNQNNNDEKERRRLHHLRESYAVERRFYDSKAAQRLRQAGLTIPRLIGSDLDGSKPWPVVCMVLNDLTHAGFSQHPVFLSVTQAKNALQWIARVHALFWNEQSLSRQVQQDDLWSTGGFWNAKAPTDWNGVASHWMATVQWLQTSKHAAVAGVTTNRTKGLGQRFQALAPVLQQFLTSSSTVQQYNTLIHGDYKAANLFLRNENDEEEQNDDDDDEDGATNVAAVDFQYTGYGIGAFDVAYLLYPDARGDFWQAEDDLLHVYHETLVDRLVLECKGGPSTLPFYKFRALYELVRLQLTCYWLAKGWVASTTGEAKLVAALEESMEQIDGGSVLANAQEYTKALERFIHGSD